MADNYFDIQNTVYEALILKHKRDENFCFTLRKNFSKDTVRNYFTGTEKSNYFSFSMWEIKNGYPGASIDAIVYRIVLRENFFRVSFQLFQTKTPEDKQNELVLNLLQNVYRALKESPISEKYNLVDDKPENRMFKVILSTEEIQSEEQLIDDLIGLIEDTTPYVDQELKKLLEAHPEFEAQRVTKRLFDKMLLDRTNRTERFKNAIPTFVEIVQEVISINDLKENSPFVFDQIHKDYVWIADQSGLIGTQQAHYEIQYDKSREHSYVLIHFEEDDCHLIRKELGEQLPKDFAWYDWNLGEGIKIGGFEMSDRAETPSILYEKLKLAEGLLGDEIRRVLRKLTDKKRTRIQSLNKILYGPPGTGKTFKLKSEYFDKYITRKASITAEQHFIEIVRPLTWWQVIGIALIEDGTSSVGQMMSNRWVVQKAAFSESKNVRATLWGTLQMHTIEASTTVSYTQRQSPLIFNKNNDKTWMIIESEAREQAPELYEILESVRNFNPKANEEIKRYVFTTFHQSFSYEDFIEGIKPIITEGESNGLIGYEIQNGIFKELCLRAASDPENRYAIFIDEINRGNVSAIFGELITLVEIDKRKNGANPMSVTLPYSKKSFSVPSNVDIIGTMNTADRSVESLDTALRRRFTFEEMLPKPELLTQEIESISPKSLLEAMNQRIEVLIDRDHTIGHAFFMSVNSLDDLRKTFANKVIPLLQEYFYGDYSKMELVIGSAFFHRTDVSSVRFAVAPENFYPEGKVYHILNISDKDTMSDESFMLALQKLIEGKA